MPPSNGATPPTGTGPRWSGARPGAAIDGPVDDHRGAWLGRWRRRRPRCVEPPDPRAGRPDPRDIQALQQPLSGIQPGLLRPAVMTGRDARLLEELARHFLRLGEPPLSLEQLR